MQLIINGQVIQTWDNVSKYITYEYRYSQYLIKGTNVKVAFINDLYIPGVADRNLFVGKINVDGVDYQTEDPSVYSKGVWNRSSGCNAGFKQSQWLSCNGYFLYFIK